MCCQRAWDASNVTSGPRAATSRAQCSCFILSATSQARSTYALKFSRSIPLSISWHPRRAATREPPSARQERDRVGGLRLGRTVDRTPRGDAGEVGELDRLDPMTARMRGARIEPELCDDRRVG